MTVSCRIFGLLSVVSLAVFVLAGCARAKNTNCRELFEKYYEVNVAAFMRTMPAADSAAVRKKAEYALDKRNWTILSGSICRPLSEPMLRIEFLLSVFKNRPNVGRTGKKVLSHW